jgi:hypothetical protein
VGSPRVGRGKLAAGNIVGWGGPYSVSFSLIREQGLTLFQEQVNDEISQGAGEDLVEMEREELRMAIRAYPIRRITVLAASSRSRGWWNWA